MTLNPGIVLFTPIGSVVAESTDSKDSVGVRVSLLPVKEPKVSQAKLHEILSKSKPDTPVNRMWTFLACALDKL